MIVRRTDFDKTIRHLSTPGERSVDTETTGLRTYHQDRLFSIIVADEEKAYYFNFNSYPDLSEDWILPREWLTHVQSIFDSPLSRWYLANAKYDLAILAKEGIFIFGGIHCTEALGRVERNDQLKYGLDALAERIGLKKSDAVMDYIKEKKLWEWEEIPGKKKRTKKLYFDKVPLNIMHPYGEQDAKVTFAVGKHQRKMFKEICDCTAQNHPKIMSIVQNEMEFTRTCFEMEQIGILIDSDYCKRAIEYEEKRYNAASQEFERITGIPFQDSRTVLEQAFRSAGETIAQTDKGNSTFDDAVLAAFKSPVAKIVQRYRDAYKKANTYYKNFLYYADAGGSVHANIRQGGTGTGRVSYTDPNLQNLPDEDEEKDLSFKIRQAFIPRPGKCFVMIDYNQMEYRMMLDYAGQMDIIAQVNHGMDIHEATAKIINEMLGAAISRAQAKTLNFGLLYGMGIDALADALRAPKDSARALKKAYFQALPFVQGFIRRVTDKAERVGYIFNWAGRRSYFSDSKFCYKAPNYLIQGGCGDVVKFAMNKIDTLLIGTKSNMLIQIHDEILFEMDPKDFHLIDKIKDIMETVYPYKHLKLTCSIEHSWKSWGDKVNGRPLCGN